MGFFGCAASGWALSLVGSLVLLGGMTTQNLRTFAVLYVCGNVIALTATGFLLGPKQQCMKMWHPCRRYTTTFYLIMLIVVFVVAILKQSIYLVLFLLAVEILAAIWYSISYIPGGRLFASALMRRTGVCFACYYVYDAGKAAAQPKSTSMFSSK